MTFFTNVNVGSAPNDGTGDSLRQSFQTINSNFRLFNSTIWPDVAVYDIYANVKNIRPGGISTFNLLQADTVQSKYVGNVGTGYTGNLYNASDSFQGNIGRYGANRGNFTDVNVTGTITTQNLQVNGSTSFGSVSYSSINGTPIGNASPSTGGFTDVLVTGNISMTGGLILNAKFVTYSIENFLTGNLASTTNVALVPSPASREFLIVSANTNVTLAYGNVVSGVTRTWIIKNRQDGVTRQVVMPNNFNNKGNTTVIIQPNASVMLNFISVDNTSANVFVNITNS